MCDHSSSEGSASPLTAECLNFYDNLRMSPNDVLAETRPTSHVVRTTTNGTTYRLCHLASMLPFTSDGTNLQPDFGLFTEAAGMLAMIDFNGRHEAIVPDLARIKDCDVRLTMEFQDTQFSPIEASRILTQDLLLRSHSLETPRPVSMVGATRSAVTGPLAVLGGISELPIVSYGSTSSNLDSAVLYPLFGRTVPTNTGDAIAAISYLRHVLGVTHCGCMFVKDGYGIAFHEEFRRAGGMLNPPMTVASAAYDPNRQESIQSAVEILKRSKYTFVFGIISTPTYDSVMREAYRTGVAGESSGVAWLLSDSSGQLLGDDFGYDATTQGDIAAATNGVGIIRADIATNDAFSTSWTSLETNDALKDYFVSKHDPEVNFTSFRFSDTPSSWELLQYDAVVALGLAACEAGDDFFTGPHLFEAFVRTSFQGASGLVEFDKRTGTRDYESVSYKVVNVVARPVEQNKITFDSTKTSFQVGGEWIQEAPFVYSDGTTIQPPPPGLPFLEVDLNLITDPARIAGLTLSAVVMAGSLSLGLWTLIHRKSFVVRLTQPFFLSMICIGTFLMGSTVIFMSFQEPTNETFLDIACMTVPWLLSLGFVIAFSALLSKTLRINRVVHRSGGFRRVVVKVQDVLIPFLVLFILNFIILMSWTIVDPLRWTRIKGISLDQYGRSVDSYGTCQSEDAQLQLMFYVLIAIVDISSLLFANVANYRARHVSTDLHESGAITFSAAIMLEATLIGVPALLVVDDKPTSYFIMRTVLVTIFCAAILLPLFIPKIIQARKEGYRTRGTIARVLESVTAVFEYVKYWKPVGVICTTDRSIRNNILDRIEQDGYQPNNRIFPVGRLDKDTSGLILLTSDGRLPNSALRGQFKQPKRYNVLVNEPLTDGQVQELRDGVVITTQAQRDGKRAEPLTARTKPCLVQVSKKDRRRLRMTLVEGRNRQIRKMIETLGLHVVALGRYEFMGIGLDPLKGAGEWEPLSSSEMEIVSRVISSAQEAKEATVEDSR